MNPALHFSAAAALRQRPHLAVLLCALLGLAIALPGGATERVASDVAKVVAVKKGFPLRADLRQLPGFSGTPADEEFLRSGLSEEPLVPVTSTQPEENRDLADALSDYHARSAAGARDGVDSLVAFLARYPSSAWTPSLQLNLGIL